MDLGEHIEKWIIFWMSRGGEKGREKAFDRIWRLYRRRVLYFVRQRCPADAEDLVQDIFLKVFRNLHQYDPSRSFSTWVFAVARNHCIDHATARRPIVQPIGGNGQEGGKAAERETPESMMLAEERDRRVGRALEKLDTDFRETAYLKYYEGLRTRRIAEILGIPEGTVKSRLHAIRAVLKEALKDHEG